MKSDFEIIDYDERTIFIKDSNKKLWYLEYDHDDVVRDVYSIETNDFGNEIVLYSEDRFNPDKGHYQVDQDVLIEDIELDEDDLYNYAAGNKSMWVKDEQ